MEDVKSEKIEYLFLDIEWNQAPGTSDLDGREAIQIGVVAADAQIQKVKAFSKAIRLSDPKLFNKNRNPIAYTISKYYARQRGKSSARKVCTIFSTILSFNSVEQRYL